MGKSIETNCMSIEEIRNGLGINGLRAIGEKRYLRANPKAYEKWLKNYLNERYSKN